MLSHEDERRLHAIERHLLDEDPTFVRRFRRHATASMSVRHTLTVVVTTVLWALAGLGVVVVIAGLLTGSVALVVTGGALSVFVGYEFRRARRRR